MKNLTTTHIEVPHAPDSRARIDAFRKSRFAADLSAAARAGWMVFPFVPVAGHLAGGRRPLWTEPKRT